jgi:hypothetical protein
VGHIQSTNRHEAVLFPERLDNYIAEDNPVRFLDTFVDELDLATRGCHRKPQKKQRKLSAKAIFLRQFVLVFPSLAAQGISGATALAIYRCRWQIA